MFAPEILALGGIAAGGDAARDAPRSGDRSVGLKCSRGLAEPVDLQSIKKVTLPDFEIQKGHFLGELPKIVDPVVPTAFGQFENFSPCATLYSDV